MSLRDNLENKEREAFLAPRPCVPNWQTRIALRVSNLR